ncbi:MAG: response regulator [Deltaproteobacteria bacterium]|nr:response regulator [Deltaproteobacteria bacterium]
MMARILIVDDSPTITQSLANILARDDHVVCDLKNFADLPSFMRSQQPDAIILDLEMPALSGVAFAHFVRKCESRPTPILLHSSQPMARLEAAAKEIGAAGVLPKGTPERELRATINRILDGAGKGPRAA